jgi:ribosomal protein L21
MKRVPVSIGDQVYAREDSEVFGSVLQVREHELVIDVEGFGEVTVEARYVKAVHDGKVIVDVTKLGGDVRRAIGHAHDSETE